MREDNILGLSEVVTLEVVERPQQSSTATEVHNKEADVNGKLD